MDIDHWTTVSLMPWVIDGHPDVWLVTGVTVQSRFRGQGWASKLLDEVLADADREGVTLLLNVDPDGTGLDEAQLRAFYSRRGFVPWAPAGSPVERGMRREPVAQMNEQAS